MKSLTQLVLRLEPKYIRSQEAPRLVPEQRVLVDIQNVCNVPVESVDHGWGVIHR